MKQLIGLVMIACLLPSGTALAKNPCKDDRDKFCKDVKAAGGKVSECLEKHLSEISVACKERLTEKGKSEGDKAADTAPAEAPAAAAAPGSAETQAE